MKIAWLGPAPWFQTAYGKQTATWASKFVQEGHKVDIIASAGLQGAPFIWNGVTVWPADDFFDAAELCEYVKADLLITLRDVRSINPEVARQLPCKVAAWCPIDCEPVGLPDRIVLQESGIVPIAMSRFGKSELAKAGFKPLYVPHGVDTLQFCKSATPKTVLKESNNISANNFVIGINATNIDSERKSWYEQLKAFKAFHARFPESYLLMHTKLEDQGGSLNAMLLDLGLLETVGHSDQFMIKHGLITDSMMARWYSLTDVVSLVSQGEGFCVPIIEAQACSTPVITGGWSAMPELNFAGWKIYDGQEHWNATHSARWTTPSISAITNVYVEAYEEWLTYKDKWTERQNEARTFSLRYDVEHVFNKYWKPVLAGLENSIG
jgi:glycosyltransferase involved in cell wall biosynthesis